MGNGDNGGISATEREVPPSISTGSSLTKERSRKRDPNTFENESSKSCNCKKSKCLKLYCQCFSYGQYCAEGCGCQDCYNTPDHEDMVLGIRQQRESSDPSASNRKITKHATEARQNSGDDVSTQCSKVGSECASDYSSEFITQEIFKSREALIKWARDVGRRNGFVIVIKTSAAAGHGNKKPRVTLGCERSGCYRDTGKNREVNAEKKMKLTSSKKCGCPFSLLGKNLGTNDDWMLHVVCGVHNHPAGDVLEGHSYAGRLSEEETSLLVDMSKNMVQPKEILVTLKERCDLNVSTMKTIYNARHRFKVAEKAGRTQMQQLFAQLVEHKYIECHRKCDDTETITDLFWTHPTNLDLLRAFPHVLIMDCTCKTNRYRMPLLEIVGVTSTDLTFSVCFAYLQYEREDNYTWALGILRSVIGEGVLPSVIVTDREMALMKAISTVFPGATHFLCRWNINRNVFAKCKKPFETKEKWDRFIMSWDMLVSSSTEEQYILQLAMLNKEFNTYPEALEYVRCSWLDPYRDKFVAAWTDRSMHFGNTTTNRAGSSHALKRQLGSSQGTFESYWMKIHNLLELQHTNIKASFEKSKTVVLHIFKPTEFKELRGNISISALEKILAETKRANSVGIDQDACGCVIRHTHGLPCAHEIAKYIREGRPIPLDCIHPHWCKLDMLATATLKGSSMELDCLPELELIAQRFKEYDSSRKLQLLNKLRELAVPVIEPEVKSRTLGRPHLKANQQMEESLLVGKGVVFYRVLEAVPYQGYGDKIKLPPSCFTELSDQGALDKGPMYFRLSKIYQDTEASEQQNQKNTHSGVLEFTAPEGSVELPPHVWSNLFPAMSQNTPLIEVRYVRLPKGTYAKLQPDGMGFSDIPNHKAVLETSLRQHATLSEGDMVSVSHGDLNYKLQVLELKPSSSVSVLETDIEVDIVGSDSASETTQHVLVPLVLGKAEPGFVEEGKYSYYKFSVDNIISEKIASGDMNVVVKIDVETNGGDTDLYVSRHPVIFPSQHQHEWSSHDVGSKILILSPKDQNLIAGIYSIGVFGFKGLTKYHILVYVEDCSNRRVGEKALSSSSSAADTVECQNCKHYIPTNTIALHEAFCSRHNVVCQYEGCGVVLRKEEMGYHVHCMKCRRAFQQGEIEKHMKVFHEPLHCLCGAVLEKEEMVQHQSFVCPLRLIPCRFCGDMVQAGSSASDFRDRLRGLSEHESVCGSRTAPCDSCGRSVMLKEMDIHRVAVHQKD